MTLERGFLSSSLRRHRAGLRCGQQARISHFEGRKAQLAKLLDFLTEREGETGKEEGRKLWEGIRTLHGSGQLIVVARIGIRIMLWEKDIAEMLQHPIVIELEKDRLLNLATAWCNNWCRKSGELDFFNKHTLQISNGAVGGIAVDSLWCQTCKVGVDRTEEEMLAHIEEPDHSALVKVHAAARACEDMGTRRREALAELGV